MRKLIPVIILTIFFMAVPDTAWAQKKKPKAKTDPSLTISNKKTKKVKKKIDKRKAKMRRPSVNSMPLYWRKESM